MNATTLPSFVGLTTLSSLTFCMLCLLAAIMVKHYEDDKHILFVVFLVIPFGFGFCLLVSVIAYSIVRWTPRLNNIILSDVDKKIKARAVSISVLCIGMTLALTIFIVG